MKATPNFAIGQVLGTQAFNKGLKRVPCTDSAIEPYIKNNEMGDVATIQILKGWLFGWDNANINEYINL